MKDNIEKKYWDNWYKKGGTSGQGSEGELQIYKINYINNILNKFDCKNVFDFGCGDGTLAKGIKSKYNGIDISNEAIEKCKKVCPQHQFNQGHFEEQNIKGYDCVMCIDVLYHIMEDGVFEKTLENIFNSEAKIIILYTIQSKHIVEEKRYENVCINRRDLGKYLPKYYDKYELIEVKDPVGISAASFMVFKRK